MFQSGRASCHKASATGHSLCYFGGALALFAQGDLCFLVIWLLFLGPIVAPLVGVLWPLLFFIDLPTL